MDPERLQELARLAGLDPIPADLAGLGEVLQDIMSLLEGIPEVAAEQTPPGASGAAPDAEKCGRPLDRDLVRSNAPRLDGDLFLAWSPRPDPSLPSDEGGS